MKKLLLSSMVAALTLAGCGGVNPLVMESRTAPIQRFDPPLPTPVQPADIEIVVVTPDVARQWNEEIEEGTRAPYAVFGMSDQDYLSLAAWIQDLLRHSAQLRAVVEFYRNPPGAPD